MQCMLQEAVSQRVSPLLGLLWILQHAVRSGEWAVCPKQGILPCTAANMQRHAHHFYKKATFKSFFLKHFCGFLQMYLIV